MAFTCLGMSSRQCAAATLAVVMYLCSAATADIIIDDFTSVGDPNPWPASMSSPGNNLITEVGLGDVLGGVRQTTVFGETFESGGDVVSATIQGGLLEFTSSAGADGALSLFYTGFPSGLNADFSTEIGIQLDFASYGFAGRSSGDGIPAEITVDIYNGSTAANHSQTIGGFGPQSVFFDFSLFSGIESINLGAISRVVVSIDTQGNDIDYQLDTIRTIPGPGGLVLIALAGVGARRRRRR